MLEVEEVEKTTCCLLTDKEEIGSVGATGMQSRFFENSVAELMDAMGEFSELSLRRCLANSSMLSSDVNAAYDPLFANAFYLPMSVQLTIRIIRPSWKRKTVPFSAKD